MGQRLDDIIVNDTDSIGEEEATRADGELKIGVVYPEWKFIPY